MHKKTNRKKLTKSHTERLRQQHKEHNKKLKQSARHAECLTFSEYVDYVFGKVRRIPKPKNIHYSPTRFYQRETNHVPSAGDGIGNAERTEIPKYGGDYIKGIGTMHKSNLVPITDDKQAKDLSRMRR